MVEVASGDSLLHNGDATPTVILTRRQMMMHFTPTPGQLPVGAAPLFLGAARRVDGAQNNVKPEQPGACHVPAAIRKGSSQPGLHIRVVCRTLKGKLLAQRLLFVMVLLSVMMRQRAHPLRSNPQQFSLRLDKVSGSLCRGCV